MAINIPGSLKLDTDHTLQCQPVLKSTSQQGIDPDANYQQHQLQDQAEQDAYVLHDDDDHTTIDSITEGTSIQPEQSLTELLPTDNVTIPTE